MKERIQKAQGYADILLSAYYGLRGNIELLKPALHENSVVERYGAGDLARGFLVIRWSLFFSCVLDITRLTFDDDLRISSVQNLMEMLKDDQLRSVLRGDFSIPESFDTAWSRLLKKWEIFGREPWAEPFKAIRNKWIAHLEVRKEGEEYKRIDISKFGLNCNRLFI